MDELRRTLLVHTYEPLAIHFFLSCTLKLGVFRVSRPAWTSFKGFPHLNCAAVPTNFFRIIIIRGYGQAVGCRGKKREMGETPLVG